MQQKTFDYKRYLDFTKTNRTVSIQSSFDEGILASGAVINKDVWNEIKFDEQVIACEDKIWSYNAIKNDFVIIPSSATYLHDTSSKSFKSNLKTYYIETLQRAIFFKKANIQHRQILAFCYTNFMVFLAMQLASIIKFILSILILVKVKFK